jgi:hypothetical protein
VTSYIVELLVDPNLDKTIVGRRILLQFWVDQRIGISLFTPPPLLLPLAPLKHGTHVAPDASMKWDIQRRIIRRRDELKKRLADTSKWIFYKVWTCKRLQLYIFTIVYFCYFFNYIELLIFSSHIYVNMIYYNIYYIYQCHTVLTV